MAMLTPAEIAEMRAVNDRQTALHDHSLLMARGIIARKRVSAMCTASEHRVAGTEHGGTFSRTRERVQ